MRQTAQIGSNKIISIANRAPLFAHLAEWAATHLDDVEQARRTYDSAATPAATPSTLGVEEDRYSIAEVAATVLREGQHAGRIYELTGPASITPRQRARVIREALGQPVRFVDQTRGQARAQMMRFMPEPVVDGTLAILGEPTPEEQRISPHVEQILGRVPRTFEDWARRHIDAFR